MAEEIFSRGELLSIAVRLGILSFASYFTVKWLVQQMDPTKKAKDDARKKAVALLKNFGISNAVSSSLDDYELTIATNIILPGSVPVSWNDIGGLDDTIKELRNRVILPMQKNHLFRYSPLLSPPKGILLHGPPGCGKTLIAKAIANEARCTFINLEPCLLQDKWYGESQKLTSAVFRLAKKLQPCIIFIDEIDCLLRSRDTSDHEATVLIKATFMQQWDGLISDPNSLVILMGATNIANSIDRAILRRMPASFHINLPTQHQRKEILRKILREEHYADDLDFDHISSVTKGFSGSDLMELCRAASLIKLGEMSLGDDEVDPIGRPLNNEDFLAALKTSSRLHFSQQSPTSYSLD